MASRGTQTRESGKGAQLRIHFNGLSLRMGLLAVAVVVLCILNGATYYLYWRPYFLDISPPPVALNVAAAGVFFLFITTQLVIQVALRIMINHMSYPQKERRIRLCYLLFILAITPSTVGQLLLYSKGGTPPEPIKSYKALFVVSVYLNLVSGVCSLAYVSNSICVDWLQAGVARAALEKRAKKRVFWTKQFEHIIQPRGTHD